MGEEEKEEKKRGRAPAWKPDVGDHAGLAEELSPHTNKPSFIKFPEKQEDVSDADLENLKKNKGYFQTLYRKNKNLLFNGSDMLLVLECVLRIKETAWKKLVPVEQHKDWVTGMEMRSRLACRALMKKVRNAKKR